MEESKNQPRQDKKPTSKSVKYTASEYAGLTGMDAFDTAFVKKMYPQDCTTVSEWTKKLKRK